MKKILLFTLVIFSLLIPALYSSFRVVEVYVCDESPGSASIKARVIVNDKDILEVVSYCNCTGMGRSFVTEVEAEKPEDKGKCAQDKTVYSCLCVGRSDY